MKRATFFRALVGACFAPAAAVKALENTPRFGQPPGTTRVRPLAYTVDAYDRVEPLRITVPEYMYERWI